MASKRTFIHSTRQKLSVLCRVSACKNMRPESRKYPNPYGNFLEMCKKGFHKGGDDIFFYMF